MEKLGQYILSVIVVAIICTIATSLTPSENGKKWIHLLSGLMITVTVIKPVSNLNSVDLSILDPSNWPSGEAYATEGEKRSSDSMATIIKYRTEAYILDKATELGISITATVFVSDDQIPVPVSVELKGTIPDHLRLKMERLIQEDLGITKENMQWKD